MKHNEKKAAQSNPKDGPNLCAGLVGPKIEIMHATRARSRSLKGQMRADVVRRVYIGRLGTQSGVTLGSLCPLWGHFGITLGI